MYSPLSDSQAHFGKQSSTSQLGLGLWMSQLIASLGKWSLLLGLIFIQGNCQSFEAGGLLLAENSRRGLLGWFTAQM